MVISYLQVTKLHTTPKMSTVKYCFTFFGRTSTCENKRCKYSHDTEGYMALHNLKTCPNDSCTNMCKQTSIRCSECIHSYSADRRNNSPCFAEFGKDRYCPRGTECAFSHDPEVYKRVFKLKECPNDCPNWCKEASYQCAECTMENQERNRQSREQIATNGVLGKRKWDDDSSRLHECDGVNCSEMTMYRFCKECHSIHRRYMAPGAHKINIGF